jgi:hypothetical protein
MANNNRISKGEGSIGSLIVDDFIRFSDGSEQNTATTPSATTSQQGIVQLSDSTSTTSSVLASTPTATKSAYDLANTANTTASAALSSTLNLITRGQSDTTIDIPDRYIARDSNAGVAGTIYFSFFTPTVNMTISQISMATSNIAQVGSTLTRFGLYTFDGTTATLVARTASDTTIFSSTSTVYTRSFSTTGGFPATYDLIAGTRYGFGYIIVGATTMPQIAGIVTSSVAGALSPRISGNRQTQTDLSSGVLALSNQIPWFRGS